MKQLQISGVYPHLAVTHQELKQQYGECGIGAVIAYGDRLYWITYPASVERGGAGRIYSMDAALNKTQHPQSTGGTHADRMIHHPSGALILGANVILPDGTIRAFDVQKCIGRLTGAAVHPKAAEGWAYIASMEDGLYEVNLHTMEVRVLRKDIIDRLRIPGVRPESRREIGKLDGDHAKGFYTGQGVAVYSNNGHGGVLAEWDQQSDPQDKASWKVIERAQFTEITGPGGVYGARNETDPIWALGWDKRSVLLCVREDGEWTRFRLPKASYTQDADNGWFTEWPRIRRVFGKYLMCMHGMLYEFPENFGRSSCGGIIPISRHLKMIADYEEWEGRIAFACDDASGFENPQLGQCQSNLWFADFSSLKKMSAPSAWGGLYVHEAACEACASDPFFVGGFDQRILHLHVRYETAGFVVEIDRYGTGEWEKMEEIYLLPERAYTLELPGDAQWIRLIPDRDLSECTAYVYLAMAADTPEKPELKKGLLIDPTLTSASTGRLIALNGTEMKLGYLSNAGYYEADETLNWTQKQAPQDALDRAAIQSSLLSPRCYLTDHSVLVIDTDGKRYQLPYLPEQRSATMRVREVVTERSLMNLCGTIYELPRPESGGVRRIKPVTTHGCAIEDFVSWRGLLVMSGVDRASDGEHIFHTADGNAAVWCGVVDDLWSLGAPRGEGGPLFNTPILAGEGSDPFLLAGYRHKRLRLSHDQDIAVHFTLECDFAAEGDFVSFMTFEVPAGETLEFCFDDSFVSHWIRFRTDRCCKATALFDLWCG